VLFSAIPFSQAVLDVVEPTIRARVPGSITFNTAYLEDSQIEEKSYRESVSETLRRRYAKVKLDVVIVCNPAALHFAVEYRDKIFPGVPIVFVAVGAGDLDKQKMWPGVTGVASPWGFRETIELMLRLQLIRIRSRLSRAKPIGTSYFWPWHTRSFFTIRTK
jgi:hypothetical protein